MTNIAKAEGFGELAAAAMREGLEELAIGYARLAAHHGMIYLRNRAFVRNEEW
jgi:RAB protein geranylgeranyltransferase component A